MGMNRRQFAAGTFGVIGASWLGGCGHNVAGGANRGTIAEPIAETRYGKVRGIVADNGTVSFKAIPYGAPTRGALRYMPPAAPENWAGVKDCFSWGNIAPQATNSGLNPAGGMAEQFAKFFGIGSAIPVEQSEDCLGLNVYTPALDRAKRPVMFWIHGGGFGIGGSTGDRADGTNIAASQDVVTVSINHRLGAMGYCHLGAFDPEFAHAANIGQLDIIAALKWVKDNIEAFGGDPSRIMIHGESGGGGKIGTLMGMPAGEGLYHSAILQSGSANRLPDVNEAGELAGELLRELEIPESDVRQIQNLPFEQIIAAASAVSARRGPMAPRRGFVPTQGTVDLPRAPIEAVRDGAGGVPVVIGTTEHEMTTMLMGSGAKPDDVTEQRLQGQMRAMLGEDAAEIIAGTRELHPDYSPGDLLVRIWSDSMRMGSIELAEAHVKAGAGPTWMYLFAWQSPVLPHLKAAHGIDGTFYYDNTESVEITAGNAEAKALAGKASAAWASVARDGKPAAEGLPAWPQYSLENRETMILSADPHIANDPLGGDRELRQKFGGGGY